MKKLLKSLAISSLIALPIMSVVACSDMTNYNLFMEWVNKKDSFIVYIGAEDCPHCMNLDKTFAQGGGENANKQYLQQEINKVADQYNKQIIANKDRSEIETFWGDEIKSNNLDFREIKVDTFQKLFTDEDWAVGVKDWIIEQYLAIFKAIEKEGIPESEWKTDDEIKEKIQAYFDGNMGTPYFISVVNGKLAGTFSGFTDDESLNPHVKLQKSIVDPIKQILGSESYLEIDEYDKIMNSATPAKSTSKSNYNFDKNTLHKFKNY